MTLYLDVIWLLNWLFELPPFILDRQLFSNEEVCSLAGMHQRTDWFLHYRIGVHSFLCNCRPSVYEDFLVSWSWCWQPLGFNRLKTFHEIGGHFIFS